jgi:3-oxoadipate enol-lactonase
MNDGEYWLERDDAHLHWRMDGAGPAVLLLHGWALDLHLWDLQVRALAPHFTLVRFDRRGFGRSRGEPSLRADADDALAILDAADIHCCAVVGMSQGARVAAALAHREESRITHVVLDGAPALIEFAYEDLEEEIPLAEYQALLARDGIDALRAALARHSLLQLAQPRHDTSELLNAMLASYPATDLRHHAPPAANANGRAEPPAADGDLAISQPTLILNGARDSALRLRTGEALAAHITDSRRIVLHDAGHLACLDQPLAYSRSIAEFIASS